MKSLALAALIACGCLSPAAAQMQNTPALPPSTYPSEGAFCGLLALCDGKAAAPRPAAEEKE